MERRIVAICIPTSSGRINVDLTGALMYAHTELNRVGVGCGLMYSKGCSLIATARNRLVRAFIHSPCTHMLFIDDDIVPTGDEIVSMVMAPDSYDVLAGAYLTREDKPRFMLNLDDEVKLDDCLFVKVNRAPTGFMRISRHVAITLWHELMDQAYSNEEGDLSPVFGHNSKDGYVGEDYYFCDLVNDYGFSIYVNPWLNLGHIHETVNRGRLYDTIKDQLDEGSKERIKELESQSQGQDGQGDERIQEG